jgi:hypothetical protein
LQRIFFFFTKKLTPFNFTISTGNILQRLLYRQESAAVYLLSVLETALVPSDVTNLEVQPIQSWAVAVKFARIHNLPLPESLPTVYAKSEMWLPFVTCLELYQYPIEQV